MIQLRRTPRQPQCTRLRRCIAAGPVGIAFAMRRCRQRQSPLNELIQVWVEQVAEVNECVDDKVSTEKMQCLAVEADEEGAKFVNPGESAFGTEALLIVSG